MSVEVIVGDCRQVLSGMEPESIDAVVCDPPYELAFMGKGWDSAGVSFDAETWRACLRVLKPGGHVLAFGGTRTVHRIAVAIEDAGFEIRDQVVWLYGSGFPKSHNIGDGLGTALKPAHEPVVVARKPLCGTVAANVERHGTGALNIDGCRIEIESLGSDGRYSGPGNGFVGSGGVYCGGWSQTYNGPEIRHPESARHDARGRWPANVCLDDAAAAMLDAHSGERKTGGPQSGKRYADQPAGWSGGSNQFRDGNASREVFGYADTGGASRFFYVAKASRSERNAGLDGMPETRTVADMSVRTRQCNVCGTKAKAPGPGGRYPNCEHDDWRYVDQQDTRHKGGMANVHPTVKPIALMRWLVRLVTPPNGVVCDPFLGSGTTGCAAVLEGFDFIGIEQDAEYAEIARRRIAHARGPLFAEGAA